MLWGGHNGGLEVRSMGDGSAVLCGRFPYGAETELRSGRREVFSNRAFGPSLAAGGDVHFLVHHDFDKPLASRSAGSLKIEDGDAALTFEATLAPSMVSVGYVRDFLGALQAGLVGGISPGFNVPENGAIVTRSGAGLLRTVKQANLVEISAVTKPAYPQAQIEARNWDADIRVDAHPNVSSHYRWRA